MSPSHHHTYCHIQLILPIITPHTILTTNEVCLDHTDIILKLAAHIHAQGIELVVWRVHLQQQAGIVVYG